MAQNESEPRHTVVIVGVTDAAARLNVARALSQVAKNQTADQIIQRLDSLPWTLTRSATPRRATRLVKMLEPLGAEIKVIPPLARAGADLRPDTEILPGAELLSQSQIMSATQFMTAPGQPEPGTAPAPGREAPPAKSASPVRAATRRPTMSTTESGAAAPAAVSDVSGKKPDTYEMGEGFSIEPMSIGEILDRSFHICRVCFWKLVLVVAIPWLFTVLLAIPLVLLFAIGLGLGPFAGTEIGGGLGQGLAMGLGIVLMLMALVLMIAVFFLSQGAMIHAVSCVYLGRDIDVKESYRFVYGRLFRFMLTSMLFTLVIIGLSFAPFFIGIVLFAIFEQFTSGWWSAVTWPFLLLLPMYAFPKLLVFDKVIIIEDIAYFGALSRSWNLISGSADGPWPRSYWLKCVVLLHVIFLILIGISLLFSIPANIIQAVVPQSLHILGTILGQIIASAGSIITTVFNAVVGVVFYYDIRNRKEGFDLRMLAGMQDRL